MQYSQDDTDFIWEADDTWEEDDWKVSAAPRATSSLLSRLHQQLSETEAALAALEAEEEVDPVDDAKVSPLAADGFADVAPQLKAAWPKKFCEAWPLRGRTSLVSTELLRPLPVMARRAVNGGKPSLPAVKALCECVRKATSLGSAALPPLQRLYAWLLFETAADVQEWIAQVRAHEALVSALALPCRQVALWSCHVITGAASNHQRNAKAFAKAGADQALRGFAGRYVQGIGRAHV